MRRAFAHQQTSEATLLHLIHLNDAVPFKRP
jgi:hypothetical protein